MHNIVIGISRYCLYHRRHFVKFWLLTYFKYSIPLNNLKNYLKQKILN